MACYRPLDGYRQPGGGVRIGFEPPGSLQKLAIPCGRCFGCTMEYRRMWAIRCQHEAALYDSNLFVTLTYDEENLPWHRGLELDHMQRFLKRLRKKYEGDIAIPEADGKRPIRYYLAGEYGEETDRPHWHLLLFNLRLPDYHGQPKAIELASMRELWPFGHHQVDQFTPARAAYTAGYAAKKVRGYIQRKLAYDVYHPETGEIYERRPPFATMSRRPVGLGVYYFRRFRSDFLRGYVGGRSGTKERLPRLYHQYLREDQEWAYDDEIRREEYLMSADPRERWPDRLLAKEAVAKAKFALHGKERAL